MKLIILTACYLFLVTTSANAQLPANPWNPTPAPQETPTAKKKAKEPEILTYDAHLPIDPWAKYKKKEPVKPHTKEIPKINGLSINPIDEFIEQKKQQGAK